MWGELAAMAAGLTQSYLASCPRCPEHHCPDCNCGRCPSIPACPACLGAPATPAAAPEVQLEVGLPWSWGVALLAIGCLAGACGAESVATVWRTCECRRRRDGDAGGDEPATGSELRLGVRALQWGGRAVAPEAARRELKGVLGD
ncbi:unnamed protein product [Prorocentrum cordatum]|uniref:Uncharacterized protein n=1 Tax=Prorocentrum cordatum TaxID=2364126 RepID=A0ABN9XVQ1_9DINO|nr:unnamed protein product [Polarella glacialis]